MSIVVDDIPPINQYVAGGGQTVFAFTFAILNLTDLNVYLTPDGFTPNDVTDILTYNVDYTVINNVPPAVGGTITLMAGATAGDIITIVRNMPYTFTNNYIDGAPLTASSLNSNFDANVMMAQQDKMYNKNIGPTYNVSALVQENIDTLLPTLPANSIWMKNNADSAIVAVSIPPGGGSAILPTTPNLFPIFDNASGVIKDSNFTTPFTQGLNGQPMVTNGANPAGMYFPTTGGYIYQTNITIADTPLQYNQAYVLAVNAAGRTLSLPTISPVGSRITITTLYQPAFNVTITQPGVNQHILSHDNQTTIGVGGTLQFGGTNEFVTITLLCVTANTTWNIESTTATDLIWT